MLLFTDYENSEITFEQESAHRDFLLVFEDLLDRFLSTEKVSSAEFFEMIRSHHSPAGGEGRASSLAMEIVDVIYSYTELHTWHESMLSTARQRVRYAKQRTALQEAAERRIMGESKKNAERHRFDL